jgi:hypothetical protein
VVLRKISIKEGERLKENGERIVDWLIKVKKLD